MLLFNSTEKSQFFSKMAEVTPGPLFSGEEHLIL